MANVFLFLQIKANCSPRSLKKSVVSDLIVIQANRLQKKNNSIVKFLFFICFWQFFPFLCPRANLSHPSLNIPSFLQSDLSDWLPSLFLKEWLRVIHSDHSWQKSEGSNSLFLNSKSLFYSQKRVNCSKTDEQIPNTGFSLFLA